MAHEIRMTMRVSVRLDTLNLAEVAKLYNDFQNLQVAVFNLAKDDGLTMDHDEPKLVTVRTISQPATTLDLTAQEFVARQQAEPASQPTLTPAELAELEVPERLRREGRKL